MSKSLRERPPRLEQLRMARHQVDAALHENPLLADAAPPQLARQLEAARRVMPEQIVGDEDVVADRREVAADRVDRSLAHRARVQLPDRAERAAERAAARRLDRATPAGAPGTRTGGATAPRDGAPAAAPRRAPSVPVSPPVRHVAALAVGSASPGTVRQRRAAVERVADRGSARSPSSSTTASTPATRNGSGYAAAVCPPTTIGTPGESARPRGTASSTSSVSSACMAAMPTSAGRAPQRSASSGRLKRRSAMRDAVAARLERRGDVFHAERLDAEERAEAEALVRGHGTQAAERSSMTERTVTYDSLVGRLVSAIVSWSHRHRVRRRRCESLGLALVSLEAARADSTFDTDVAVAAAPRTTVSCQSFRDLPRALRQPRSAVCRVHRAGRPLISEYDDQIAAWVDGVRGAPKSRASTRGSSTARAISAGWPIASCWCSTIAIFTRRSSRSEPGRTAEGGCVAAELLTVPLGRSRATRATGPGRPLRTDARGDGRRAGRAVPSASAPTAVTPDGRSRLVIARPKRPCMTPSSRARSTPVLPPSPPRCAATTAAEWRGDHDDSQPPMRVEFAVRPSHRGGNRS